MTSFGGLNLLFLFGGLGPGAIDTHAPYGGVSTFVGPVSASRARPMPSISGSSVLLNFAARAFGNQTWGLPGGGKRGFPKRAIGLPLKTSPVIPGRQKLWLRFGG